MDPLSWTGAAGAILNPLLAATTLAFVVSIVSMTVLSFFTPAHTLQSNPDGSLVQQGGIYGLSEIASKYTLFALLAVLVAYIVAGVVMPYGNAGILGAISKQFTPVWIALVITFALSITFKRRLGIYGKLFDNIVGMVGFGLVMFWVFTAVFVGVFDMIATHDPLSQLSGLKNKVPGVPVPGAEDMAPGSHYLLGGDNLARDVFSRMIHGSWIVIQIAPLATMFAFMVGITLGLPAGYFGGRFDTALSFLANLILAFPVILLFYLLVTPEMVETGIPTYMAAVLFIFPLVFFAVLLNSRYHTQPSIRTPLLVVVLGAVGWIYLSLISQPGTVFNFMPGALDLFDIPGGILVVFVSVVFVNSPTIYRIVRGLAMDIKTRDYVAAAQTRGEGSWYIMLWEILPNARGPLIVDFCLRIGYATILLGTLGFFGLGLPPESPDWGSTINAGRGLLSIYPHPALVPAIALLSMVLGLNLLADGLREESLKD
ncbi:ABC transporter permease [Flavimaricola marinus]|uniref:Glutathione transport system permease protein GsiD n=1 Tax=Flavimaricola marinus TaxID=1819565 RepID=A0A238LCZ4_9RHOB|nr:ABC transporter permease [Flavimaricola marinus]SMY07498.1 Glutathione transport system permease protein GsiD [Flavimaricola marinus]